MRKKDRRPHKPVLRPSTSRNFCHHYIPLLKLFVATVLCVASFFCDEYVLLAIRLVAQATHVTSTTVILALAVYVLEVLTQLFLLVHLFRPQWLPLHRYLRRRTRYSRTHISHLRQDRAVKFGLAQKAIVNTANIVSAPSPPSFSLFALHPDRPYPEISSPSPSLSLFSVDTIDDRVVHEDEVMPELLLVSDDEDEDEDEDNWSSDDESGYSDSSVLWGFENSESETPVPHIAPCSTKDALWQRRFRRNGSSLVGGGDSSPPWIQFPSSTIDVTSDEDSDTYARNRARSVPHDARLSVIPDHKISVTDLLSQELPPQETDARPASFSNEEENMEGTSLHWYHLLSTSIPFLPFLRASFHDAWRAGAKSICFPHLPGHRFPLWTENFLNEIKAFVAGHTRWQSARDWLSGLSAEDGSHASLLDRCWAALGHLPWDMVVPGLSPAVHLTTQDLASLLGNDWLNDDLINAGVDYILRRLEPWSRIRILNCLFIQSLANARATGNAYNPSKFFPIEKAIRAGVVDTVYFPLHVAGNHWTLLKINLLMNTIAFADSLGGSPPADEIALVRWWLKSLLPSAPAFSLVSPDFHCPRQRDGHSCGIIVLSILAAILLDYDAWTPDHADCHRLQWFLNLSDTLVTPSMLQALDDDETDSVFSDAYGPTTTPEPSDFEDAVLPSDSYAIESDVAESAVPSPSRPISPFESSPSSPMMCDAPPLLQLEDIDFFLDLPASGADHSTADDISPVLPDHPSTDTWVSLPPSGSNYYGSDGDDSDSHESQARRRKNQLHNNGPKAGSSWAKQKELKSLAHDPEFEANPTRLGSFRDKIRKDDRLAEFDDSDVRRVRCSRCSTWINMRVLYDVQRWHDHRKTKKCNKHSGSSTPSLFTSGFKRLSDVPPPPPPRRIIHLPCPGLTRESDEKIATYLSRTSVTGGGAPSRTRLALDLFSIKWSELTVQQQRVVLRRELTLQKWKIGRAVGAVFSATCLRDVDTYDGDEPHPCAECENLYQLHTFQVAISRPMPEEGSMKFVPVAYRDKELGTLYLRYQGVRELIELEDGRSPWLKFAQGCVDGTYTSDTLTGMVKAMVLKSTRIKKGKSLKNLKYPAEFDQFCNLLASTSPRAYLTFQKSFGGPGLRAMRAKRAKNPRFQPDLSAFNVATAAETLKRLKYHGPLSLSWDDTALEACISVYQESKEVCLIVGAADGAIRVTDKDDLDALFEAAKLRKADKLRVWLLSIPLPKIPPIMVAALARGSSTRAEDLAKMHHELADLLHAADIHPISLASDGAEVERSAQRMIASSAPNHYVYVIPNPTRGCQITLTIPLYYGRHPTIIVQDSKHALKTARNQILTGARILVLGFFVVMYSHIRDLAANIAGPLFTRDVEKVDKQDDRAAARMFSGNTLDFQLKNYPGQTGVSVYLFVLGEMIDAWQNRHISHRERVKMVLRARFFLMAWRSHIEAHPEYNVKTQFISRESYDIFLTICDGLLALIVSYRKYFPTYPLLPWLHSTEVCEHLFGMLRQLKKDFNYADVLYLERKLRVLMMGAFGNLSPDQQENQTSAGYVHTYFKADDLDTAVLLQYPTDEDIENASKAAFAEATQLLKAVGIDAELMLSKYQAPEPVHLRPPSATARSRPPQTILELLAMYEPARKSPKEEENFEACELALVAEGLDKSLEIAALPDSTDESLDELCTDIESLLASFERTNGPLPPLPADYALSLTLGGELYDLILVSERMRHQTKSTQRAVRQHGRLSIIMQNRAEGRPESGPSLRETLIKRLAAAVPSSDMTSKTTGVDRYVRHAGTFGGSGAPANVRVQNKATVKSVAAAKFGGARAKAFSNVQWMHEQMYLANITELNPLKPDDLVIFLNASSSEVQLGSVVTMYTKNTMHDWIPNAPSIGTPSYIYVLAYRPFAGAIFTSIACEQYSCPTVLQVPRTHILFSLASYNRTTRQLVPTAEKLPHTLITLCADSLALFQKMRESKLALSAAVRDLVQLMKDGKSVDSDAVNEPEEVEE
ncbi:hypothetical protein B0H16DRAFT_1496749 [Mycena metata]|uniref:Ubiquitin-like protease family profile domain-containing protein n=1 Tax=Mycena metata TaxID=1033252 RepID=A0AAD7K9G4_9AGAR|nr:hypothetical protein B0H16DRAFT_1496749 [Mycena metata]